MMMLNSRLIWNGNIRNIARGKDINNLLKNYEKELLILANYSGKTVGLSDEGEVKSDKPDPTKLICKGIIPSVSPETLGSARFRHRFGLKYSYIAGGMASAISSKEMVIKLAKSGYLGTYGTNGLDLETIENDLIKIKSIIPEKPFAFNIVHNIIDDEFEMNLIRMFLKYKINIIEVSSFSDITLPLVYFRVVGMKERLEGGFIIGNKIIAKVGRIEIAEKFLKPAPRNIVNELLRMNLITDRQAQLANKIPMVDAITMEGDSARNSNGGNILYKFPELNKLRDYTLRKNNINYDVFLGAAGGIGSHISAYNMFNIGADYIVTGSINQCSVESGTSDKVKNLLASSMISDIIKAPYFNNLEYSTDIYVLKKGTLFPMRANTLYDFYKKSKTIEELSKDDLIKLEKQIFKKSINTVLHDSKEYFKNNKLSNIEKLSKETMLLILKWYLTITYNWSKLDDETKQLDYQIWTSPAMGIFNLWVKDTYLENHKNRYVTDIADIILKGAAYLQRANIFKIFGGEISTEYKIEKD
jgi:PfaD family protein